MLQVLDITCLLTISVIFIPSVLPALLSFIPLIPFNTSPPIPSVLFTPIQFIPISFILVSFSPLLFSSPLLILSTLFPSDLPFSSLFSSSLFHCKKKRFEVDIQINYLKYRVAENLKMKQEIQFPLLFYLGSVA